MKGRARALKQMAEGNEIPLGVLKPGDSFGEAALMEGGTRNATVRCSTAVEVLRIDRSDFLQLVQKVPDLKHYVEMTGRSRALQSFLYQFSNFGRLLSLSVRLFANMLVGEKLELVFTQLVPILVPAVFGALHVFVSLLQAYIFMLLPAIYISMAVSEEH